ncbi:DUF1214 domain-containing protein [Aeromonas caviae]|uniref:DUF1214 domain-containing protein n=1 Tax=Aeromonas caviae TaxID=648 RepID=UPI0031FD1D44
MLTPPGYSERHFDDLHAVASVEPVREQDKVMMGMLTSLGIGRGTSFNPDEKTRKALRQAAIDAWFYMQHWYDNFPKEKRYWPDRHYASLLQSDDNKTFTYEDRIDLINRAAEYFWCTYMRKVLSDTPATQYLMSLADSEGRLLEAGQLYKLTIPAKMPVKQFWALTVYNRDTMSFIYSDSDRTTLSSYDLDKMAKNPDGGVTLYVGPTAPPGKENNWIPTSGKRPLPAMRFYGPTDELNHKTFKLADFERV